MQMKCEADKNDMKLSHNYHFFVNIHTSVNSNKNLTISIFYQFLN